MLHYFQQVEDYNRGCSNGCVQ